MSLTFEWNENKANSNKKKHGVPFPETTTIFGDPGALTIPDPKPSTDEERKIRDFVKPIIITDIYRIIPLLYGIISSCRR